MNYFVIIEPFDIAKNEGYALYYNHMAHIDDIMENIVEWIEFDCFVKIYTYKMECNCDSKIHFVKSGRVLEGSDWYYN